MTTWPPKPLPAPLHSTRKILVLGILENILDFFPVWFKLLS